MSDFEDFMDYAYDKPYNYPARRYLRDSENPLECYDEVHFRKRFRFRKETVVDVLLPIINIEPNVTNKGLPIPPVLQLLIALRFYATGNFEVYLSKEHFTLPEMATHSLTRDIVAICNDTDDIMRFIWLPERIANIVNVVMTPCWGVIQPRSSEWITMTVYSLQEPATFTTTIACEILNLTERRAYQRNELLKRSKIEKSNQEFTITENGTFQTDINRCPPFVLDLKKPHPFYLAMTVALSSKGQRDGFPRLLLKQMWEQTPPYDLLCSEINEQGKFGERGTTKNNIPIGDIIRIIDGILWDAMHCKMFKNQIKFYAKEEIPTYHQLNKVFRSDVKARLSRRVTSGICDAIVNKALFHVYNLNPKHDSVNITDI